MSELLNLIGKTPLIRLKKYPNIFIKLEYLNPTGSHKDRTALYMIRDAERRGLLNKNGVIVEASSGNTAISVAWISRILGYRAIVVVEESTSKTKVAILRALGAEVIKAPDVEPGDPRYFKNLARRTAEERGGVFLNQFENRANVIAHYETTGREIWDQTKGKVEAFVMGVGTGGTLMGVGKYLKEKNPGVRLFAVAPRGSPLKGGSKGEYIEGLVERTIPKLLDLSILDEIVEVPAKIAEKYMLKLINEEGILAGPSTGANFFVCLKLSKEMKNIVTIAADSAFRYPDMIIKKFS